MLSCSSSFVLLEPDLDEDRIILLTFLHWGGEHVGQFLEYCGPDVTAAGTSESLCLAYVCSGVKTLFFFLILEGVDGRVVFAGVSMFSFMAADPGNKPLF